MQVRFFQPRTNLYHGKATRISLKEGSETEYLRLKKLLPQVKRVPAKQHVKVFKEMNFRSKTIYLSGKRRVEY